MADFKQARRITVSSTGVQTLTDVFKCAYCGHMVTGSTPSYTEEFGTPNTGGSFACRARGGTNPHVTH